MGIFEYNQDELLGTVESVDTSTAIIKVGTVAKERRKTFSLIFMGSTLHWRETTLHT